MVSAERSSFGRGAAIRFAGKGPPLGGWRKEKGAPTGLESETRESPRLDLVHKAEQGRRTKKFKEEFQ